MLDWWQEIAKLLVISTATEQIIRGGLAEEGRVVVVVRAFFCGRVCTRGSNVTVIGGSVLSSGPLHF